jgi:hypothetical protein
MFPQPQYTACSECGACIPRWEVETHECDPERKLDYELVRLRPETAAFERNYNAWLGTLQGRFAAFYAERTRP